MIIDRPAADELTKLLEGSSVVLTAARNTESPSAWAQAIEPAQILVDIMPMLEIMTLGGQPPYDVILTVDGMDVNFLELVGRIYQNYEWHVQGDVAEELRRRVPDLTFAVGEAARSELVKSGRFTEAEVRRLATRIAITFEEELPK
jgi:hypothetical protein